MLRMRHRYNWHFDGWKLEGVQWSAMPRQIPSLIALFLVVTFGSALDVAAIQQDVSKVYYIIRFYCSTKIVSSNTVPPLASESLLLLTQVPYPLDFNQELVTVGMLQSSQALRQSTECHFIQSDPILHWQHHECTQANIATAASTPAGISNVVAGAVGAGMTDKLCSEMMPDQIVHDG